MLDVVRLYADSAQTRLELNDIEGVRRSIERLIANVKLVAAAVRKVEEIDAEASKKQIAA